MEGIDAATKSLVKRGFAEGNVASQELIDRIFQAEEEFYRQLVSEDNLDLPDGLIVTQFIVDYKGGQYPLPYAVALAKADTVDTYLSENGNSPNRPIWVNDSVWAIGNSSGRLTTAINKTDPNRNHGDVERLSSFFRAYPNFYLYSLGANIFIDSNTGERKSNLGILRVGQINPISLEQIQLILGEHLPKTGAFDLAFILDEKLVKSPSSFKFEEKIIDPNGGEKTRGWERNRQEISYNDLHLAAHGLNPFETL